MRFLSSLSFALNWKCILTGERIYIYKLPAKYMCRRPKSTYLAMLRPWKLSTVCLSLRSQFQLKSTCRMTMVLLFLPLLLFILLPIRQPTLSQYPDERQPLRSFVSVFWTCSFLFLSLRWLIEFEIYALSAAGGFVILSFLARPIRISFVCLTFFSVALIPLKMVE